MPNIEIHGLENGKACVLRERIFVAFASRPYAGDLVVTIFPTDVTNNQGVKKPFLRLVNTKKVYQTAEIVGILKVFKMDIERLEIAEFILGI